MTLPETSSGSVARRWLANVGSGYADAIVGGLVFLLLTPVFVRSLGTGGYAAWLIAHTFIFYLGFLDIGFGHAQVRFHARWAAGRRTQALHGLLATTTAGLFVAGLAATVIGLLIAWVGPLHWFDAPPALRGDLRVVLALLSLNLLLAFPSAVLSNLYRGAQRFDLANACSIVLRLITAGAQWVCLQQGQGVIILAAIELAMTALRILLDLAILSTLLPDLLRTPVRWHPRTWRGVRRYALWSAFEDLLVDGATQLEQVLIVVLLPLALLTPYALPTAAAGVLLLAVGPLAETFLPMAAQLHAERNDRQLAQLLMAGSKMAIGIAAPAAVFLWVFGDAALALWSPEGVAGTPPNLLRIIVLNCLMSTFLTTSAMLLLAAGRVRTIALLTLLEVLLSTLLIVVLAPRYGLLGVASGLLIANVLIGFALQVPIVTAVFHLSAPQYLWTSLGRVLLAAAPVYAIASIMQPHIPAGLLGLLLAAGVIGTAYLVALLLLGTTAKERAGYTVLWQEMRR